MVDNIRMDLWDEGGVNFLVGKPGGKRTMGRNRRMWLVKIGKDLWVEGCV